MTHILVSLKYQSARGNKTKQNFGLTGFPNASSRVSTGTSDEEAPVTLLHFGLPYRWAGLQLHAQTGRGVVWARDCGSGDVVTYDPNLMTFWCKTETDIAYVVYVIVMAETAASQTVQQEPEEVHNWLSEARVVSQSHTLTLD